MRARYEVSKALFVDIEQISDLETIIALSLYPSLDRNVGRLILDFFCRRNNA